MNEGKHTLPPEAPAGYIAVKWDEYKELLIIKGKYEELSKYQQPLIIRDGWNEKGTTIISTRDLTRADPSIIPPYKVTC